jgi:sodium/hydrogen exchanger-like protein 6/7
MFGESVLNNVVAISITRTLERFEETDDFVPALVPFVKSVGEFIGIFGASCFVGSILGCSNALLTKLTHIQNFPMLETTLFILMSYSSFLISEALGLTGIVAVLFCGICQAHYTYNNMSDEGKSMTKQFFGLLNFISENFIFSYIGVSIFTFPKYSFNAGFIFAAFVAIIVGRALNVCPLLHLLNFGRKHRITTNLQHMIFFTGFRGAISFALSIRNTLTTARQIIFTTTLFIIFATVLIGGGSTITLLSWLEIPMQEEEKKEEEERAPLQNSAVRIEATPLSVNPNTRCYGTSIPSVQTQSMPTETTAILTPVPTISGEDNAGDKSCLAKYWSIFDHRYMKPLLTHTNPTLMDTLPVCCLPLGRLLTSTKQLLRNPEFNY